MGLITCRVNIFLFDTGFDVFLDSYTVNTTALSQGLHFRRTNLTICLNLVLKYATNVPPHFLYMSMHKDNFVLHLREDIFQGLSVVHIL
jgi:hypothetical protein